MPNAFPICNEGCIITGMRVGTVYQFGTNNTSVAGAMGWVPAQASVASTLPLNTVYTTFPFDPAPYQQKELAVQEQATSQVITYTAADGSQPASVTVPALALSAPATNACSTNNASCTVGTNSDAAHIITTSGDAALNPTETATLKAAIQALQYAQRQVDAAQAALQTVQQTIAGNHGADATGPYQISTDFDTTIEQIPPAITIAK
jgi:hypothetical protein